MATVYPGTGTKIARLPGIQPLLDTAAGKILRRAQGLASAHVHTGRYLSSLGVRPIPGRNGVTDREVYADDPGAIAIEFGHVEQGKRGATWVPGQHILLGALYGS